MEKKLYLKDKPILNPILVYRHENDKGVFFHYNTRSLFRMSSFAANLLLMCDGQNTIAALIQSAASRYQVDKASVANHIRKFLQLAVSEDLIRINST